MTIGPDGTLHENMKLNRNDQGGLRSRFFKVPYTEFQFAMDFGTLLQWVALTPDEGAKMIETFRRVINQHCGELQYDASKLPIKLKIEYHRAAVMSILPASTEVLIANAEVFLSWADKLEEAFKELEL